MRMRRPYALMHSLPHVHVCALMHSLPHVHACALMKPTHALAEGCA